MANITFITGPMFSGKSARLLELILLEKAQSYYQYLFIRPVIDNRGFITRDKVMEKRFANSRHNIENIVVDNFTELNKLDLSPYEAIFIDELHLFNDDEDEAHLFFKKIVHNNIPLIAGGLNGSSEQESFVAISRFLPFITKIELLETACYNQTHDDADSHAKAGYTKWVGKKSKKGLIEIGDSSYVASCAACLNKN
ncbi:MAG: hypothetical protein FWE37_03455 [Spirochaetaceae bacterium]|nr:hypothetical protein [Spirochaetaceae bacterium]